jgi:hypothetical protein
MEVSEQLHALATLAPGMQQGSSTQWIEGWVVGPSSLVVVVKRQISFPTEI